MRGKVGALFVLFALLSASVSILPFTSMAEAQVFEASVSVNGHESGDQISPRIAVDPMSNISVVWADLYGGRAIYYGRSEDGGASFLSKVRVDDAVGGVSSRSSPAVAVNDTGSVFVVWSDDRSGVSRIYFSKSDDNGSTFSANVPVVPLAQIAQDDPDIAIANSTIYVVWAEDTNETVQAYPNIFMSRSLDWGQTFLVPGIRIDSTGSSLSTQAFPSIAAMGDYVFITWHDSRTDSLLDIYGAYSNDSGSSFGANVEVSDGKAETRQAMSDAAVMPDGEPCAVWHDERSGSLDIRFARSNDGGAHFLSSVLVSDGSSGSQQADPQIAVDMGGNISVAYRDNMAGTYHVRYALSRNSGASFSASVIADNAPPNIGTVDSLDVATGLNGTPLIAYDDNFAGSMDIYFTKMIDRPPICKINYPADGATINGEVAVIGNASDPDGNETLDSVQLRVVSVGGTYDSGWQVASGKVAWEFVVNASALVNGPYEIRARSYDGEAYSETALITVTVENEGQKWPDLAITPDDITFSPNEIEENDIVTISVSVWNLGSLNATNVDVKFQRGSILVGETQLDLVPFGENRTASVHWQALPGTHQIKVTVDPANEIVELNETNNQASKMITVNPSTFYRPDLEISVQNFTLSSNSITDGDNVNLTAQVFNYGNESANNVMVVFSVDGIQVGAQQFISYIPIGESRTASVTWVAAAGHHNINVTVDPSDQIAEWNELNNRASRAVDVSSGGGGNFPVWIIVAGVAIPLVLAVSIIYVMKWRRPKY